MMIMLSVGIRDSLRNIHTSTGGISLGSCNRDFDPFSCFFFFFFFSVFRLVIELRFAIITIITDKDSAKKAQEKNVLNHQLSRH